MVEPMAAEVMKVFNRRFANCEDHPTELKPSAGEPQFVPSLNSAVPSEIMFANGFVASALHEVAHWCIAGRARRQLNDYGYWYRPDGRSAEEQERFFDVEANPQALEWIFSMAVCLPFYVSCDNLNGTKGNVEKMRSKVTQSVKKYLTEGLPSRAQTFLQDLLDHFGTHQNFQDQVKKIMNDQALPG